ncbi:hypothetical protein C8R44DRAFT_725763 [Mycena epipterygia]|nr:hypothetical protein C8R44DRAFT_725763 [Mycena epipterygia]
MRRSLENLGERWTTGRSPVLDPVIFSPLLDVNWLQLARWRSGRPLHLKDLVPRRRKNIWRMGVRRRHADFHVCVEAEFLSLRKDNQIASTVSVSTVINGHKIKLCCISSVRTQIFQYHANAFGVTVIKDSTPYGTSCCCCRFPLKNSTEITATRSFPWPTPCICLIHHSRQYSEHTTRQMTAPLCDGRRGCNEKNGNPDATVYCGATGSKAGLLHKAAPTAGGYSIHWLKAWGKAVMGRGAAAIQALAAGFRLFVKMLPVAQSDYGYVCPRRCAYTGLQPFDCLANPLIWRRQPHWRATEKNGNPDATAYCGATGPKAGLLHKSASTAGGYSVVGRGFWERLLWVGESLYLPRPTSDLRIQDPRPGTLLGPYDHKRLPCKQRIALHRSRRDGDTSTCRRLLALSEDAARKAATKAAKRRSVPQNTSVQSPSRIATMSVPAVVFDCLANPLICRGLMQAIRTRGRPSPDSQLISVHGFTRVVAEASIRDSSAPSEADTVAFIGRYSNAPPINPNLDEIGWFDSIPVAVECPGCAPRAMQESRPSRVDQNPQSRFATLSGRGFARIAAEASIGDHGVRMLYMKSRLPPLLMVGGVNAALGAVIILTRFLQKLFLRWCRSWLENNDWRAQHLISAQGCAQTQHGNADNGSTALSLSATLPPEIITIVIEQLHENKPDLLTPVESKTFRDSSTCVPGVGDLRVVVIFELVGHSHKVPTYTGFVTFVSGLPVLKSLTLWNVSWATGPDNGQYTFPPFDLASLELDWGPRPPIGSIMFALRTRKLILGIPSSIPPSFLPTTFKYLRQLGSHLKHLELEDCENHIDQPPRSSLVY